MSISAPARNANRLLIADADPDIRRFAAQVGEGLGFTVSCAGSESQFREEFARFAPTVILVDPAGLAVAEAALFRWLAAQHGRPTLIAVGLEELGASSEVQISVALKKPLTAESLEAALAPQRVNRRVITADELRRAVDRAQLLAHYQPKVRQRDKGWVVTGIEALLRWDHADYGLIYPDEFIGLAEQHGLIAGLTDYVLQAGIDQIGEWNRSGMKLDLSVNLSPTLLTDIDFPDRMSDFLSSRGVAPEQLTLEITETAALANPAATLEILSRLRERRIGLALDDFGIGYSSLTQLYKLPFSEVKIDHSIGMELTQTAATRTIVRAMIDLGHHLGLRVCCEGVESKPALDFLQQCGCDFAQGYFIARPMGPEELAQWIADANPAKTEALRIAS